jgi:hypothetical protein
MVANEARQLDYPLKLHRHLRKHVLMQSRLWSASDSCGSHDGKGKTDEPGKVPPPSGAPQRSGIQQRKGRHQGAAGGMHRRCVGRRVAHSPRRPLRPSVPLLVRPLCSLLRWFASLVTKRTQATSHLNRAVSFHSAVLLSTDSTLFTCLQCCRGTELCLRVAPPVCCCCRCLSTLHRPRLHLCDRR